jgi:hypothetical protein
MTSIPSLIEDLGASTSQLIKKPENGVTTKRTTPLENHHTPQKIPRMDVAKGWIINHSSGHIVV